MNMNKNYSIVPRNRFLWIASGLRNIYNQHVILFYLGNHCLIACSEILKKIRRVEGNGNH